MSRPHVTVAIPTHPARLHSGMLNRALASVATQTLAPAAVSVAVDLDRQGAAPTRQRALDAVRTEWTAFLDSDDEFQPEHLQALAEHAQETGADYVFSYFNLVHPDGQLANQHDPFVGAGPQGHFGRPFDPQAPHQTTITVLVRTELAKAVGFVEAEEGDTIGGHRAGEDWHFTLGCIAQGARIVHLPARTWRWHHHGLNSSGMPGQGDAA